MRKWIGWICLPLILVSLLAGCANTSAGAETEETKGNESMLSKDKTYQILFVGNSYTFFNDMPTAYFEPMAKICGYNVHVTSITKGAYTLEKFANPSDTYGRLVENALANNQYDYVIIQEQSVRPAINAPAFYDGVRALTERIRSIGAQPVLYATWGRKEGADKLTEYNMTSKEMTWKLAAAYDAIAKELDIPVIHVGLAFADVYENSSMELYNADKSHPSHIGSYLAAMALFCGIFREDPGVITITGPVKGEEDAMIREAVKKVTRQTPQIPEEYVLNSEGVTVTE